MESVSIVVPVYDEEANIEEVYSRTNAVLSSLNLPYEIIFVDDGSKDSTCRVIKDIQVKDNHIKLIKFVRNYGQVFAILAGFEFADGSTIIAMDADLQNDPKDIPKLLEKINEGFDLVNGWRYRRNDPFVRKLISYLEMWLIRMKTGIKLHDYGCGFFAVKKQLVKKLNDYGSRARFIKPLAVKLANSFIEIKIEHYPRRSGLSKYDLLKIIKTGIDFLFHFSIKLKEKERLPCVIEKTICN